MALFGAALLQIADLMWAPSPSTSCGRLREPKGCEPADAGGARSTGGPRNSSSGSTGTMRDQLLESLRYVRTHLASSTNQIHTSLFLVGGGARAQPVQQGPEEGERGL